MFSRSPRTNSAFGLAIETLESRLMLTADLGTIELFDINNSGAPIIDETIVIGDFQYFAEQTSITESRLHRLNLTTGEKSLVADINEDSAILIPGKFGIRKRG